MSLLKTDRPKIVLNDHLEYLDALEREGVVDTVGAPIYLRYKFSYLTFDETEIIVFYWENIRK
jgi:hypothetical protein